MRITTLPSRVRYVYKTRGLGGIFRRGIEVILEHTLGVPKHKFVIQNSVAVRTGRLLDAKDTDSSVEKYLVRCIRDNVRCGEDVVVIGGGSGISTVWLTRIIRPEGSVTIYEPGSATIDKLRETVEVNGAGDIATVKHAAVGPTIEVRGSAEGCQQVDPEDLPECDVLEMDCDGAEVSILQNLTIRPRLIIVETHGVFGTPEEDVQDELEGLGYEVVDRTVQSPDNGIIILAAEYVEE